ncbi:MAG: DUF2764 family protein [Candidatus Omnitrophica bacterium]|nr:DUF2764 family protein [Candidatus Omnitrophota bacterium]
MDKYYYLNASLPYLSFPQPPVFRREELLSCAEEWLGKKEQSILQESRFDNFRILPGEPLILRRWKKFEYQLRKELSFWRQKGRKSSGSELTESLKDKNPLECEYELISRRWEFLDELEEGHFFDFDYLVIYSLKLSLLEYWFSFNKEKGRLNFEALVEL